MCLYLFLFCFVLNFILIIETERAHASGVGEVQRETPKGAPGTVPIALHRARSHDPGT